MNHIAVIGCIGGCHIVHLVGKISHARIVLSRFEIIFWRGKNAVLQLNRYRAGVGDIFSTAHRSWVVVYVSNYQIRILWIVFDFDILRFSFGEVT